MTSLSFLRSKKWITLVALLLVPLLFLNANVYAQDDDSDDDEVSVRETTSGNLYYAGEDIEISKDIEGDVILIGEDITVEGNIQDNAYIAGGKVLINGDINGDLNLTGGYVVINGDVNGDVRIAGGKVYVNSNIINGDADIAAVEIGINSETQIGGEDNLSGSKISTNAKNNPTNVDKAEDFNFDIRAIDSEVLVLLGVLGMVAKFLMFIGFLITGYLVIRFFPSFTHKTTSIMKSHTRKSILVGMVTLVLSPFIALFLIFSVIGWNLLSLLLVLSSLAFILSGIYSKYYIGKQILARFNNNTQNRLLILFVGALVIDFTYFILALIPGLGWLLAALIKLTLTAWVIGAILLNKHASLKS